MMLPIVMRRRVWPMVLLTLWLQACSPLHTPPSREAHWSGRLSVHQPGEVVRVDHFNFSMGGTPDMGWLTIQSPLGQTVAELNWDGAVIHVWNGQTHSVHDVHDWSQSWLGVKFSPQWLFRLFVSADSKITNWDIERKGTHQLRLTHQMAPHVHIRIWIDEKSHGP